MQNKPLIKGDLEIKVYDKDKNLILNFKKPCDSFVKNVTEFLMLFIKGSWKPILISGETIEVGFPDVIGNIIYNLTSLDEEDDTYRDYKGIWIGRGSKKFDVYDYDLDNRFTNEFKPDKNIILEKTDTYVIIQRSFDNVSGNDQIVREIGFYTFIVYKKGAGYSYGSILLCRDVISPVNVPDGGRITVKYKFEIG